MRGCVFCGRNEGGIEGVFGSPHNSLDIFRCPYHGDILVESTVKRHCFWFPDGYELSVVYNEPNPVTVELNKYWSLNKLYELFPNHMPFSELIWKGHYFYSLGYDRTLLVVDAYDSINPDNAKIMLEKYKKLVVFS